MGGCARPRGVQVQCIIISCRLSDVARPSAFEANPHDLKSWAWEGARGVQAAGKVHFNCWNILMLFLKSNIISADITGHELKQSVTLLHVYVT